MITNVHTFISWHMTEVDLTIIIIIQYSNLSGPLSESLPVSMYYLVSFFLSIFRGGEYPT